MLRLLIITDFTESFATKLLKGIVNYSRRNEQWTICRMPPSYKANIGIPGVVRWAKEWGADAVIGRFEETDDVNLFRKNGIVVIAQDFKKRFSSIPNITADYEKSGKMAAQYFIGRGFRNFGFFGFTDVCWSDERCEGFRKEIESSCHGATFSSYRMQDIDQLWFYERKSLNQWLQSIPKPIAIMACDDNQGNNLIEACHALGIKIPLEVSVMGVDNDDMLCNLGSTSLSSIDVDIEAGGYRTAQLIEKLVADPDAPAQDILLNPGHIVSRMSTAAYATDDTQIAKAILYIHHNYQNKITVNDVLQEVALSRRLLERRFKNVTGRSIYQYITDLKLKQFARQLLESEDLVVNIAMALGENDTKNISRLFKKVYGCAPNEWRERNRSDLSSM